MLGPLVISAAVFRVDGSFESGAGNLWETLSPLVAKKAKDGPIPVNDSKKLFTQGQKKGLRDVEEGLLPFVRWKHGRVPKTLREYLHIVAKRGRGAADAYLESYPWYASGDVEIPCNTYSSVIKTNAEKLEELAKEKSVEFLGLATIPVEVVEFNRGIYELDKKSSLSFRTIAFFLRRLWKQFPTEDIEVVVDRQGGRSQYSRLLFESVKPQGLNIEEETEDISTYRLLRRTRRDGESVGQFRVTFRKQSEEENLPVALASMSAKYVRELHMHLFNRYFTAKFLEEHQEELKPTAGYVQDARRFLADTEQLRARLSIDPALLIRRK